MIATSGPSINFPKRAYRNPLDALVNFLDNKHGKDWRIWEFRAEGTGYPDSEVYHRIHHYPWPDHHPPPFALIPAIMGSMRNWLQRLDDDSDKNLEESEGQGKSDKTKRVAVVHCKAGKGRSGTIACGYMISEQGWTAEKALQRFTERRMRVGFGAGVSIPSQLRYVEYIDRWVNSMSKKYVERPVEIMEIHVWGLKDGVKVAVEGFVEGGKQIKCFHLFHRNEKTVVDDGKTPYPAKTGDNGNGKNKKDDSEEPSTSSGSLASPSPPKPSATNGSSSSSPTKRNNAVIFRPSKPIILPSSDVNIDFERRSKAAYTGWAMVTSIAHIWFNAYFEGGDQHDSNVFEADWEALDGIKGTTKKGVRALDRVKVIWRYPTPSELRMPPEAQKEETDIVSPSAALGQTVTIPKPGEPVPESSPADWHLDTSEDSAKLPREEGKETDKGKENLAPRENIAETTDRSEPASEGLSGQDHPWLSAASAAAASAVSAAMHPYQTLEKELGLRKQEDESLNVSLANSEDEKAAASRNQKKRAEEQLQQQPHGAHAGVVKKENPEIRSPLEAVQSYFGTDGGGSSDERDKK